jgi:5'-3' exonuclease
MRILVVDGNNLAFRSWHAAHGSMSVSGEETGSLHLFVQGLAKHVRDEHPDKIIVCWDSGSSFRENIDPEYKASRRARVMVNEVERSQHLSFNLIHEFLQRALITQWSVPGQEADDLIAAVVRHRAPEDRVIILSSDKDLLQLLSPQVRQIRLSSHDTPTDEWTEARFAQDRGYQPHQLPYMMALMGDPGDGIPGLRNIGPKRAFKMLSNFDWDLAKLIRSLPEDQQLVAIRSWALVDLLDPIQDLTPPEVGWFDYSRGLSDEMRAFCERWQMKTLLTRLADRKLWSESPLLVG